MIINGYEEIIVPNSQIEFFEFILNKYFETHEDQTIYRTNWSSKHNPFNYYEGKKYIMSSKVYNDLKTLYGVV